MTKGQDISIVPSRLNGCIFTAVSLILGGMIGICLGYWDASGAVPSQQISEEWVPGTNLLVEVGGLSPPCFPHLIWRPARCRRRTCGRSHQPQLFAEQEASLTHHLEMAALLQWPLCYNDLMGEMKDLKNTGELPIILPVVGFGWIEAGITSRVRS